MRSLLLVTLATCYALILAGAIVRASGSGLGCPDWPKCFGRWIPPHHISQLPMNYREDFAIQGERIAPFDPVKTWTEYLNRLLGMVVGLLVLGVMLLGLRSPHPGVARPGVGLFVLVGVQGLLGSLVVSSLLSSALVTLHMLLAMVVLFLLLELTLRAYQLLGACPQSPLHRSYGWLLAVSLVQLVLGTQGREQIDRYLHQETALPRAHWYDSLTGPFFTAHRLWAYLLAAALIVHLYRHRQWLLYHVQLRWVSALCALTMACHLLSGMAFKHLGFPAWNQPLHLLLASFFISLLFWGWRLTSQLL